MSMNPDVQPVAADISNRLDAIIAEITQLDEQAEAIGRTLAEKRDAKSNLTRALEALGQSETVVLNPGRSTRKPARRRKASRPAIGERREDKVLRLLSDGREYTTRDIRAGINEHNDNALTVMLGTLARKGKIARREVRNTGEYPKHVHRYNFWTITDLGRASVVDKQS